MSIHFADLVGAHFLNEVTIEKSSFKVLTHETTSEPYRYFCLVRSRRGGGVEGEWRKNWREKLTVAKF
jgi:hypothetical protein